MAEPIMLPPLHSMIVDEALQAGVNPALALALAHQESSFNPTNVSPTGTTGLFQVTNDTGAQYGQTPETRTNPQVSARAGLRYFRDLLDQNQGDTVKALQQYNGGSDPNFVSNVLAHYPRYAPLESLQRGRPQPTQVAEAQPASAPPSLDALKEQIRQELQGGAPAPGAMAPSASSAPPPPDLDALKEQIRQELQGGTTTPAATIPSDITLTIGGDAGAVTGPGGTLPSGTQLEGPMVQDRPMRASDEGPPPSRLMSPGLGDPSMNLAAAAALGVGATIGGATLGGLAGAALGGKTVLSTLGAIGGGLGGNRLVELAGLQPPEQPLTSIAGVPIKLSDALAVAAPLATAIPNVVQSWMARGPAGQAVTAAQDATEVARQAWQRAADAARDAQAKGQTTLYNAALKEARDAQAAYRTAMGQYNTAVEAVADAQAKGQTSLYNAAFKDTRDAQREYSAALGQHTTAVEAAQNYDTAVQRQGAAVSRLQALPGTYQPAMPPRTMLDVRLDMTRLDQGGEAAQAVLTRLGVSTPQQASYVLAEEANTLMQGGAGMGVKPQPPIPVVARAPQGVLPQPVPELQQVIRDLGGIKLGAEDISTDFRDIIGVREGGTRTAGLMNNQQGLSPEAMAEALQQRGFHDIEGSNNLLDALRQSVQEQRPVYPTTATLDAPALPAQAAVPQVSAGVGGRVSRQLYQRFTDIAGGAPIDISLAHDTIAGLQEQLKYASPRFQRLVQDITEAGADSTGSEVHEFMKQAGALRRSGDSKTRGLASQVFGALHDSLEQSVPAQRVLLQDANMAWKQEQGVADLERIIAPPSGKGGLLSLDEQGRTVLNVKGLINLSNNKNLMQWFPPAQQAALKQDIQSFIGTPTMPRGTRPPIPPLTQPAPEQLPGGAPWAVAGPATLPASLTPPPAPELLPGSAPWAVAGPATLPPRPVPVEPTLTRPPLGLSLRDLVTAGLGGGVTGSYNYKIAGAIAAAELVRPQLNYALSRAMLTPGLRPLVLQALQASGGVLTPQIQGLLSGLITSGGEAIHRAQSPATAQQ